MMENNGNRLPIIEALILSSPEPLAPKKIADLLQPISPAEIEEVVTKLNEKYLSTDSSFRIRKIAGGYQTYITEHYAGYVEELYTRRRTQRLTQAALETLAIIAYRQPVTRVDIEMIRGVSSDSAIRTLLERKLVTLSGRAKTIGRPLLYSTTDEFLKFFNLNSLIDLPKMEEIEELLSDREPDSQQSLSFDPGNGNSADTDDDNDNVNSHVDSDETAPVENETEFNIMPRGTDTDEDPDIDPEDENDLSENMEEEEEVIKP